MLAKIAELDKSDSPTMSDVWNKVSHIAAVRLDDPTTILAAAFTIVSVTVKDTSEDIAAAACTTIRLVELRSVLLLKLASTNTVILLTSATKSRSASIYTGPLIAAASATSTESADKLEPKAATIIGVPELRPKSLDMLESASETIIMLELNPDSIDKTEAELATKIPLEDRFDSAVREDCARFLSKAEEDNSEEPASTEEPETVRPIPNS
jgi:hypothetical protein